jgi:hypothetical protein
LKLDDYRSRAEQFTTEITREGYLHFSGQKPELEIERIYERHADLFSRATVDELRGAGNRELLEFAVHGFIGEATKAEEAELARREAALEIAIDDERIPLRQAAVVQANEPDADRRAALERARLHVSTDELTPLQIEVHQRGAALARDLGWPSMLAMCEELSGLDLEALERQTEALLADTEGLYEPTVEPELERHLGLGFDRLRPSDLPAFFRAPGLDGAFPAERAVGALRTTMAGLGIDLGAQPNVTVDNETRPTKSPRAFCSPVRAPEEVYLVIAPQGGRDDYEALFHEAGHTEHFAHVDPALPFERRLLGDNSFTEAFAFLFQYLNHDPAWLEDVLGVDAEPIAGYATAVKLIFLRRYSAKLAYERSLHGSDKPLDALADEYTARLSAAVRVDWPRERWIGDVDPFFYSARYIRAWATERALREHLVGEFGERWFAEPAAGDLLRRLWSKGQRAQAEELLAELGASPSIDLGVLVPA